MTSSTGGYSDGGRAQSLIGMVETALGEARPDIEWALLNAALLSREPLRCDGYRVARVSGVSYS